jgi:hypothetical protein
VAPQPLRSGESASDAAAQHGRRRVLVDLIPAGQAVLDRVLPEVQQLVTAVMGTPDDQALNTLLDHLTVVRQAPTAAPTDLTPPAPLHTSPAALFLNPEHRPDSPSSVLA